MCFEEILAQRYKVVNKFFYNKLRNKISKKRIKNTEKIILIAKKSKNKHNLISLLKKRGYKIFILFFFLLKIKYK